MADVNQTLEIDVEVKGAKKATSDLEDTADATNKANESAEKYEKTLGDVAKDAKIAGVSINGMAAGFKGSVAAIRASTVSVGAFAVALAATGITLVVAALALLVKAFASTQKGMDLIEDATSSLGAAFRVLGEATKGIKDTLVEFISVLSTGNLLSAFGVITDAIGETVDEMSDAVDTTIKLNEEQRELDSALRINVASLALSNLKLAEYKRLGEDVTQSIDDRIEAIAAAREIIAIQGQEAIDFAQKQLAIDIERYGINTVNDEEQIRRNQLIADLANAQREATEKDIEFQNKYNTLIIQRRAEELALTQAILDRAVIEKEAQIQAAEGIQEELDLIQQKIDLEFAAAEAKEEAEKAKRAAIKATTLEAQIANEKTLGGIWAVIQAKLFEGVITAITANIANPVAAAIAGAAAFTLLTQLSGQAQGAISGALSKKFALGGIIEGASHANGGVHIEAEGGEGIINKASMANPNLRAMASAINVAGGGVPFFERGGIVPSSTVSPFDNLEKALAEARSVLVVEDFNNVNDRIIIREGLASL